MNKFDWECWEHYGIEQKFRKVGSKLDELIEGYNEIMKGLEEHIDKHKELWQKDNIDNLREGFIGK